MKEPQTPEEWQECADLAVWGQHLDAAVKAGLIVGPLDSVDYVTIRGVGNGTRLVIDASHEHG